MKRNLVDFISGIAIYFLLAVLIGVSVAMRALPGQFDEWLGGSNNPQQALIYFSLLISSLVLILTRVGIEVNLFNMAKGENFRRYASGLPLWFLMISVAGSLLQFYRYFPTCKAPEAVVFEEVGSSKTYQPSDVIVIAAGKSLAIGARSADEENLLSCISWELTGSAFQTLGQKNGCQVNITFSNQPGSGYITLLASQNFCNQASLFSIEVKVEP